MMHTVTRSLLSILTVVGLGFSTITPLYAHETREGVSDAYNLTVGHRSEPVFAREPAQFDLIIRDLDGNPYEPSEVDLSVKVLYLKEDAFDAKVLKAKKLRGDLQRDRSSPNRFNIWYMPTRAGAYGFRIKGTIDGVVIKERFVCGGGSLADSGFGCVTNIQKFPGRW
ncbi:MAG: hypothetical protein GXP08_05635 [Gammaproteobacteria bacterium]|nr:hypothetical protein [Gammaproteobacteria bacterium]